jgi:hypothetical protein
MAAYARFAVDLAIATLHPPLPWTIEERCDAKVRHATMRGDLSPAGREFVACRA